MRAWARGYQRGSQRHRWRRGAKGGKGIRSSRELLQSPDVDGRIEVDMQDIGALPGEAVASCGVIRSGGGFAAREELL